MKKRIFIFMIVFILLFGATLVHAKFTVTIDRSLTGWGQGTRLYTVKNKYKYTLLDIFNKRAYYELAASREQDFYSSARQGSITIEGSYGANSVMEYCLTNEWGEKYWSIAYSIVRQAPGLVYKIYIGDVKSNNFSVKTSNYISTGYIMGGSRSWIVACGGKDAGGYVSYDIVTWD